MSTTPVASYDHPGRPTKFNPERCEKIITALRGGNYRETACKYAGISNQTLRNWLKQAENPDAPPEYMEFLCAVEKAEADAEVADIALIRRSAQDGQWQAAAWIRERKNPERWGRRDASKIEVTGADGGPVDMRVTLGVDMSAIEGLALKLEGRRRAIEAAVVELE
jgi:transposase-like protein